MVAAPMRGPATSPATILTAIPVAGPPATPGTPLHHVPERGKGPVPRWPHQRVVLCGDICNLIAMRHHTPQHDRDGLAQGARFNTGSNSNLGAAWPIVTVWEWLPTIWAGGGTIEAQSRSKKWGERNSGQTVEQYKVRKPILGFLARFLAIY